MLNKIRFILETEHKKTKNITEIKKQKEIKHYLNELDLSLEVIKDLNKTDNLSQLETIQLFENKKTKKQKRIIKRTNIHFMK